MSKRKPNQSTGRMQCFIGSMTVTKKGKTVVTSSVQVEQVLVDGQWVDKATGAPGKPLGEVLRQLFK